MPMPKATMNKHSQFPTNPCKIRFPWQIFPVNTIAGKSNFSAKLTYGQFGTGVAVTDAPHVLAAAHAHILTSALDSSRYNSALIAAS